jgi:hypothetical protein
MGRKVSESRMAYSNKRTMQIANMKFKLLFSYPHFFSLKKKHQGKIWVPKTQFDPQVN